MVKKMNICDKWYFIDNYTMKQVIFLGLIVIFIIITNFILIQRQYGYTRTNKYNKLCLTLFSYL